MNQTLTRKQFDILSILAEEKGTLSQRQLGEKSGHSLGTVNRVMQELTELQYVTEGEITGAGISALEPYRAKRAIFIAAGFGSRLVPITFNTPKPLVRVHGQRIIDGLIDACLDAGINEIYIVRGYLAEQFDQLLYKYPMIRYHYTSDFLAIKKDRTDDWCFTVKDGVIVEEKVGGLDCWQMVGISYWNEEDGHKLSDDIKMTYEQPGGKERYWEQVPLVFCQKHYKVEVRECRENDIIEIDTFRELKAIDKTYDV